MPIYAYRCSDCDFQKDVLQKFSDPPLTQCPACGHESFGKQLTAPAFQLKGTGWYVTDFRDNGKKPADGEGAAARGESAPADSAGADAGKAAAPAAAPAASAPVPAPAPAPSPASGGGTA